MGGKIDLLNMTIEELGSLLTQMGQQKFRAKQIFQWVNKGVKDIDEMTNLSKDLREKLKENAYINRFEIIKKFISEI
ncbi:MAG: 23S rRNA (adenine(2503)-C(2))-methyltransferase RlmN, partial [Bacillota bacterium]